jgi:hypothetical protein
MARNLLPVQQTEARYDVARMLDDARENGWLPIDLIKRAGVSITHGYRFFRGETQSPRTAEKLTKALRKRKGHYLIRLSDAERVAS